MARGVYRTAQGKFVNMDNLRLQNENEIAVGNMGVNARGDRVNKKGNIVVICIACPYGELFFVIDSDCSK